MKFFKIAVFAFVILFIACTADQPNDNIATPQNNQQQNRIGNNYTLEEVLMGMRAWNNIRSNSEQLQLLFNNANSFNINMELFPQGNALHAYACILDGKLKFAVISEVYDNATYHANLSNYIKIVDVVYNDVSNLNQVNYPAYTYQLPTQYIQATDAINRITLWNTNYTTWLATSLPMYQLFYIPTHSLAPQNHTVYMGLKDSENQPNVKVADLVLKNSDSFYDTVLLQPPFRDRTKNYLLDLL